MKKPVEIFDPIRTDELLRGWQCHVVRRRMIHEQAARDLHSLSYTVGVITAVFAAAAGSSAFAVWPSDHAGLAVAGGVVGVVATILASVQTFLDLGGRAERHRQAAVSYKTILRKLERLPPDPVPLAELADENKALAEVVEQLEAGLADVDGAAPVVPRRLAHRVESLGTKLLTSVAEPDSGSSASADAVQQMRLG
jgi:hypothetical protein